jgi:hypothetical protein
MVGMFGREDLDGNVLGRLAVTDAAKPDQGPSAYSELMEDSVLFLVAEIVI